MYFLGRFHSRNSNQTEISSLYMSEVISHFPFVNWELDWFGHNLFCNEYHSILWTQRNKNLQFGTFFKLCILQQGEYVIWFLGL